MSTSLEISTPTCPKLTAHIDHYYFYQSAAEDTHIEFIHFPHYKQTLNCFKNAKLQLSEYTRHISPSEEEQYRSIYHRHINYPRKAIIKGPFAAIGIVFQPLGLYYFMDDRLEQEGYEFVFTQLGPSFHELAETLFEKSSIEEKTSRLDQYFQARFRPFEKPLLQKAIHTVFEYQGDITLQELCSALQVNRRTLLRHFKQYLKCSYRDFKNVLKFRLAFDHYFQADKAQKLSELAYWANYYDQSDFIQQFKNKTNETPKALLRTITSASDNKLLWKFSS